MIRTTLLTSAATLVATTLVHHGAPVIAGPFEPFAALSRGSDCKIVLDFPDGSFCGKTIPVDSVRSWYFENGDTVGLTQRYDFQIIAGDVNEVQAIPIRFLNPGTAKRFWIQMGAWTGKPSTNGTQSPFSDRLKIAR